MRESFADFFAHLAFAFIFLGAGGYWVNVAQNPQVLELKPIFIGLIGLVCILIAAKLYKKPAK